MGLSLRGTTSGAIDINPPAVAGDNAITLPASNGSANQFFKNSGTAGIVTYSSLTENSSGDVSITGSASFGSGSFTIASGGQVINSQGFQAGGDPAGGNAGSSLGETGQILATSASNGTVFAARTSGSTTKTFEVLGNGTITATGNFSTGGSIISEANPEASNTTNGAMLDKVKVIARNATGQSVWLGYVNGTSATTSSITADGQANFSQRVFCNQWFQSERSSGADSAFYGTVGGVEKLNIRANGSASFAGGTCNITSDGKIESGSN